jgi:transcriptional antiterminator RfaH
MWTSNVEKATWRVVETKRHKERATQAALEQIGVRTYLPLLHQWPRPIVGSEIGPMFPGYVFAHATAGDFHRVGRTAGVRGFVTFGGVPACLDDGAVEFLRHREGPDGIISADPLPAGAEVLITDGPLRGLVAVVERRLTARQRVLLLLDILQRQTRVEMPERWVRQA